MKQKKMYKYVSSQGAIITPFDLEIGNPIVFYQLSSDSNKILTNGKLRLRIVNVTENEINLWREVDKTKEEIEQDKLYTDLEENNETNYKELLDIVTGNEEEVI